MDLSFLHPSSYKTEVEAECAIGIVLGLLWAATCMALLCQPTGSTCIISAFVECTIGSNMALYINDNHPLCYHMPVSRLNMLEHSYFISPEYLVLQAMVISPTNIILVGPNIHRCIKFFLGWLSNFTYVLCCPLWYCS